MTKLRNTRARQVKRYLDQQADLERNVGSETVCTSVIERWYNASALSFNNPRRVSMFSPKVKFFRSGR